MKPGNVGGYDNKYKLHIVISHDIYGQAGISDDYQALDLHFELLFHSGKKF